MIDDTKTEAPESVVLYAHEDDVGTTARSALPCRLTSRPVSYIRADIVRDLLATLPQRIRHPLDQSCVPALRRLRALLGKVDHVCRVHDADDAVPGRICGRPTPCREHG